MSHKQYLFIIIIIIYYLLVLYASNLQDYPQILS
jgi:hypothetical protein